MNVVSIENRLLDFVASSMEEALVMVDNDLIVSFINEAAKRMLGNETAEYKGKNVYNIIPGPPRTDANKTILEEVIETGISKRGILRTTADGNHFSLNFTPVVLDGEQIGAVITAQDVTPFVSLEHELDLAFALTLPNSKVEHRLKSIVEYRDRYDVETKHITITGIVENGGYRHVINCLKLFSSLAKAGVTELIGIEKDLLVQAFVFHDLGKSQPVLSIGDVVNPKEVFEDSKLHAQRSAEIALNFYSLGDDIVEIIRYHHHGEHELPSSFPWRLLPMFRLFQLIDGLSAAVTRGGVSARFAVHDCTVEVTEINERPQYNGTWHINLYTGARIKM